MGINLEDSIINQGQLDRLQIKVKIGQHTKILSQKMINAELNELKYKILVKFGYIKLEKMAESAQFDKNRAF